MTYKKCTEDLSHTFDFINIRPVIKKEVPFFEKIKPQKPWEKIKNLSNPVPKIAKIQEFKQEKVLTSRKPLYT